MKRHTRRTLGLLVSVALLLALVVGCTGSDAPKRRSAEPKVSTAKVAVAAAPAQAEILKADPGSGPPPPIASGYRIVDPSERPSTEACAKACKHILDLSVAEVPEASRTMAAEFAAKMVESTCPKNCRETGTRASVACTNAATTYDVARSCPTARYR